MIDDDIIYVHNVSNTSKIERELIAEVDCEFLLHKPWLYRRGDLWMVEFYNLNALVLQLAKGVALGKGDFLNAEDFVKTLGKSLQHVCKGHVRFGKDLLLIIDLRHFMKCARQFHGARWRAFETLHIPELVLSWALQEHRYLCIRQIRLLCDLRCCYFNCTLHCTSFALFLSAF
ncbi:hypothetical protein MBAV_001785 [Candidatus Magnetobacterium bavaricum]|uniref:Uncharacterized protein n=1 Tax=Candidatus Magnetobacterium bavaricum TaxID=29290 RepID=A0A0F3GVY0_9BACT|nr:hypothetical protein MBAV_001785 [Candidatus Magnetobacterium bavaricum]